MTNAKLATLPLLSLGLLLSWSPAAHAQNVTVVNDQPAPPPPVVLPPPPPNGGDTSAAPAPRPKPYAETGGRPADPSMGAPADGDDAPSDAPPARTGFQMAARLGYQVPLGNAADGVKQSDIFGGQVPVYLDIGGKVHPNVFVGGYLGLGIGGCGDGFAQSQSCASASFHFGAEILVSILPDRLVDPWVGYGIGIETGAVSTGDNRTGSLLGVEFGHFLGGVDFRVTKGFGIGPYLDFGVGEYTSQSYKVNGVELTSGIDGKAVHESFTLGARFVVFP
ncbi:MAG TPA: hypothetical protein VF407_24830 [Polyangiaceae bacterium]